MKTNQHHFLFVECRYLNAEESLILSFPSFSNKLDCTWGDSVKMFTTGLSNSSLIIKLRILTWNRPVRFVISYGCSRDKILQKGKEKSFNYSVE
jgi:hypothetical protein